VAQVKLTDDAKEDLRDLDGAARKLVLKTLGQRRDHPEQRGAPLGRRHTGNLATLRKLVIGDRDYRAVYRVEEDGTAVVVWVIGRRTDDECYQLAVSRLRLHGDTEMARLATALLESTWGPEQQ
jgi:mRNA interferase RelE/StbE